MITQEFSKEQVRRLQALKFFPTDPVAAKELVVALGCAVTEPIARQVIDDFVQLAQECPVPADIRRAVFAKQDTTEYSLPEDWKNREPICPACSGSGMIQENGAWVRCLCADGRDMPEHLLKIANTKPPLGKNKSDSQSRRYVDRVLIR